jgi:hypothetical protein
MVGFVLRYPYFINNNAITVQSDSELNDYFRYSLSIPFNKNGHNKYVVVMMNPSTAGSNESDKTIDRVVNYLEKNNLDVSKVSIVNLYAKRETYSKYLELNNNKHQKNISIIKFLLSSSDQVLLGWGEPKSTNQEKLHKMRYHHIALEVLEICLSLNVKPKIVESLVDGLYPRHLGRIGYTDNLFDLDLKKHISTLKDRIKKMKKDILD